MIQKGEGGGQKLFVIDFVIYLILYYGSNIKFWQEIPRVIKPVIQGVLEGMYGNPGDSFLGYINL